MKLGRINVEKIINEFGTKENFINKLEEASEGLNKKDSDIINSVIAYYNNLFDLKIGMYDDVKNLDRLAKKTVNDFERINKSVNKKVLSFVVELIKHNIEYVKTNPQ